MQKPKPLRGSEPRRTSLDTNSSPLCPSFVTSTPLSQSRHRESGYFTDSNLASPRSANTINTPPSNSQSSTRRHFTFDINQSEDYGATSARTDDALDVGIPAHLLHYAASQDERCEDEICSDVDTQGVTQGATQGAMCLQSQPDFHISIDEEISTMLTEIRDNIEGANSDTSSDMGGILDQLSNVDAYQERRVPDDNVTVATRPASSVHKDSRVSNPRLAVPRSLLFSTQYPPLRCFHDHARSQCMFGAQNERVDDALDDALDDGHHQRSQHPHLEDEDSRADADLDNEPTHMHALPDIIPRTRSLSLPADISWEAQRLGRELRRISDEFFANYERRGVATRGRWWTWWDRMMRLFNRRRQARQQSTNHV